MIGAAFFGLLVGLGVYVGTAKLLGTEKANRLPGGAIAGAILFSPWYMAVPAALVGHLIGVYVAKMMKI